MKNGAAAELSPELQEMIERQSARMTDRGSPDPSRIPPPAETQAPESNAPIAVGPVQNTPEVATPRPGYGTVNISFDTLADLLGAPVDMQVVGALIDGRTRSLILTVSSPRLPRVEEGEPLPEPLVLSRIRVVRLDPSYVK